MELITQDSYDKRNKASTIPTALAKDKIKEEPIQKIFKKQKPNYNNKTSDCGFCGQKNWTPKTQLPSKKRHL